ncbi:MAG TPA: O-antigen ligase family protein [Methylomirabilota bacterium]|nr:O-antigen ligase family protein [Methylomirabilota bacterium]
MTALRRVLLAAFVLGLGFSITLSETSLTLLTLLWLWRLGDVRYRDQALWPLAAPVLAWSAATVVSALLSGHPGASLLASKGLLLILALYVTVDALPGAGSADRLLSALLVAMAAAALMGLVQVAFCPQPEPSRGLARWFFHRCDRARGAFSIYMTLAGVLNLALLATLPRLLPDGGFRRWSVPVWVVTLGGLAATLTRGAWVGFASGVLAFLPATRRGRWLLIGGLVVLALAALAGPSPLRQRVVSMSDPHDPSFREREYMWRSGLAMWREHPWLGWGPGGVKRAYRDYALPEAGKRRTGHVHNTPLQILVERGLVGLAAWLWIWAAFYARALALLRRLPPGGGRERALVTGSVAAVTGFLVGGLSEYNFGDSEVVLVAWVLVALPFAVERGITRVEGPTRAPQ